MHGEDVRVSHLLAPTPLSSRVDMGNPGLNPLQDAREQDQADNVNGEYCSDRNGFLPDAVHVKYPK